MARFPFVAPLQIAKIAGNKGLEMRIPKQQETATKGWK
jgi:hypothetical protein